MAYLDQGGGDREVLQALLSLKAGQDLANKPTKPMPGSAGTRVESIPGVGKVVRDIATGEALPSSDLIKDPVVTAPKPTESDVSFGTNIAVAEKSLKDLRDAIKRNGTWESEWVGNSKDAATLDQAPYQLAIALAKIADPSSVAREGEVASAQKYLVKTGMLENRKTSLAALDRLEGTLNEYKKARHSSKGDDAAMVTPAPEPSESGPQADLVTPAGEDFYADENGVLLPIRVIRGQRGIMKAGKFYPIQG
jgi:hypothetical protein